MGRFMFFDHPRPRFVSSTSISGTKSVSNARRQWCHEFQCIFTRTQWNGGESFSGSTDGAKLVLSATPIVQFSLHSFAFPCFVIFDKLEPSNLPTSHADHAPAGLRRHIFPPTSTSAFFPSADVLESWFFISLTKWSASHVRTRYADAVPNT